MRYWLTDQHTEERYADFDMAVEIRVGDTVPNREPFRGRNFWWPDKVTCGTCEGRGHSRLTKRQCDTCKGDKALPVKGFHVKMRVLPSSDRIELIGVLRV